MNQRKSLKLYIIIIQESTVLTSSTRWPANIQPKLDRNDGPSAFFYNTLDLAAINASIQYSEVTGRQIIRRDFILQIEVALQQYYKQRGNNHLSREDDESDDDFEAATISKKGAARSRNANVTKLQNSVTNASWLFVRNAQTRHIKKMICSSNCT